MAVQKWDESFTWKDGRTDTPLTRLKEEVEAARTSGEISAIFCRLGFEVTTAAVTSQIYGHDLVLAKSGEHLKKRMAHRLKERNGGSAHKGTRRGKLPQGVHFGDIRDGQCRETLYAEDRVIIYCGKPTRSRKFCRCPKHGGPAGEIERYRPPLGRLEPREPRQLTREL